MIANVNGILRPEEIVRGKLILESSTIQAVGDYIKQGKAKKIIVMTGAGISTAAGIPDFRSPGTGLYDNLQNFNLPTPEAIFDIEYFIENPEAFFSFSKEMFPGNYLPTKTHYFLKLLHHHGILLRAFTQNIENLERLTGLPEEYIVEAHGSYAEAACVYCDTRADISIVKAAIMNDQIPRCQYIEPKRYERCPGIIKPNITFFGEDLPYRYQQRIQDFRDADLLIIIGTSLQVHPFAGLINKVKPDVPRILINNEISGTASIPVYGLDLDGRYQTYRRDAVWIGDCDTGVTLLSDLLGWKDELDHLYNIGHSSLKAEWALQKIPPVPYMSSLPSSRPKPSLKPAAKEAPPYMEMERMQHLRYYLLNDGLHPELASLQDSRIVAKMAPDYMLKYDILWKKSRKSPAGLQRVLSAEAYIPVTSNSTSTRRRLNLKIPNPFRRSSKSKASNKDAPSRHRQKEFEDLLEDFERKVCMDDQEPRSPLSASTFNSSLRSKPSNLSESNLTCFGEQDWLSPSSDEMDPDRRSPISPFHSRSEPAFATPGNTSASAPPTPSIPRDVADMFDYYSSETSNSKEQASNPIQGISVAVYKARTLTGVSVGRVEKTSESPERREQKIPHDVRKEFGL